MEGIAGQRGSKGKTGDQNGQKTVPLLAMMLLLIVAGFSIMAYGLHKAQVAATQAHRAICSQRDSLGADLAAAKKQQETTLKLAAEHPNGLSLGDVHYTKSQIQEAVKDVNLRVSTLNTRYHSLDGAECKPND